MEFGKTFFLLNYFLFVNSLLRRSTFVYKHIFTSEIMNNISMWSEFIVPDTDTQNVLTFKWLVKNVAKCLSNAFVSNKKTVTNKPKGFLS